MAVESFVSLNKRVAAHKMLNCNTLKEAQIYMSEQAVQKKNTGSSNNTKTSTSRVIRTKLFEWKPPSNIATKFILADT
jgi:hypothetical protein